MKQNSMFDNIVFILLPFPSHYLACFPFAKTLQNHGRRIIFTGTTDQKEIIKNEGFSFSELKYINELLISSYKVFFGLLIQSLFDKTAVRKRFREWNEGVQMINKTLKNNKPSKVFIDDHLWHYYPIVYKICPNIEVINTKLSTKKSVNIPPLDSSFIPESHLASKVTCKVLWFLHLLRLRITETKVRVALLNRGEDYFIERFAKKIGLNLDDLIDKKNCFYKGLNGVNVIILSSPLIEFKRKILKSNERYVDVQIFRNEEYLMTDSFKAFLNTNKIMRENGRKSIYCSFGTLGLVNKESILEFALKLFTILKAEPQWQLVFSTGGIKFDNVPENVILFDRIPQLTMLRNCDIMITHGGLTSIKECLQYNVPMLVYPLNKKTDQKGNAARVYNNKLGLRGDISTDSLTDIKRKILTLLNYSLSIS